MTDFQVQCFLTCAKCQSLTKAAEILFISQPAMSRNISNLERELCCQLFNRQSKPISLTENGVRWYQFFQRSASEYHQIKSDIGRIRQEEITEISISVCGAWDVNTILQTWLDLYAGSHPDQILTFASPTPINRENTVDHNNAKPDVVFHLEKALSQLVDYQHYQIATINNALFYSNKHPLAQKKNLVLKDFQDSTFFYISDDELISTADICQKLEQTFINIFDHPPKMQVVESSELALSMLEDGLGIMMRDEWARFRHYPWLKYILMSCKEPVGVGWRPNNNNLVARQFVQETVEYFHQNFKGK